MPTSQKLINNATGPAVFTIRSPDWTIVSDQQMTVDADDGAGGWQQVYQGTTPQGFASAGTFRVTLSLAGTCTIHPAG